MHVIGKYIGSNKEAHLGTLVNLVFTSASSFSVAENQIAVGTILATPTGGIYGIKPGAGDYSDFTIDAITGVLTGVNNFNYEAKAIYTTAITYSIGNFQKELPITVNILNVNEAPTDITMDNYSIEEGNSFYPNGGIIGNFSTDDDGGTHTYALVSGAGSTDNASFVIANQNRLLTKNIFLYNKKNTYAIRVRSTDSGGLYVEKAITINVTQSSNLYVPIKIVYGLPCQINLTTNAATVLSSWIYVGFAAGSTGGATVNTKNISANTATDIFPMMTNNTNPFGVFKIEDGKNKLTQINYIYNGMAGGHAIGDLYLESLPRIMTKMIIATYTVNTIAGLLSGMPPSMEQFCLGSTNTVGGSLSDIPASMTSFELQGGTVNDYTAGKTFNNLITKFIFKPGAGGGLTSAKMDSLLIDLDKSAWGTGTKTLTLQGTNAARTAASAAAVASLQAKGVTVLTN